MKIELKELLRDYEEQELPLSPPRPVSAKAIERRVERKLAGKASRRPPLRKAVLILAACLVLAGSALAYTQYRQSQVETVDKDAVKEAALLQGFQSDTLFSVEAETEAEGTAEPHVMAVRATYLPDPISELESRTLRERLTYWEEASGVSLVADSGLSDEILDGTYVRLCASSADLKDFTVVEVFSASDIHDKPIVVQGENTTVEEGTFQGMEATYLTQNYDGRTQYNLVLYDASHDCVIHIGAGAGSEIGFEELEQVAAGLELVDTGIPDAGYSNWDWTVINVARG